MKYKLAELTEHFADFISEQDSEWIRDNWDDLHYHAFNADPYIIGIYQAAKWLGEEAFNAIGFIKDYEQDNFGEVFTDFSSPESVVNMYAYILGEQIVWDWQQEQELAA